MNCRGRTPTHTYLSPLTHLPNPNPNYSLVCSISSPFLSSNSHGVAVLSKSNCLRSHRCSPRAALFSDLPLLPFQPDEVLVPSETKTLHLYEARFLALLEEVKKLEIGALVSIRGIGRVSIVKFVQTEPYLRGLVLPLQDNVPDIQNEINSMVVELSDAVYSLSSLQIKLKVPKDEPLQTPIINSLRWAENELIIDCDKAFIPSLAERISFAALQPVSVAMDRNDKFRTEDLTKREATGNEVDRHSGEASQFIQTGQAEHCHGCSQAGHPILEFMIGYRRLIQLGKTRPSSGSTQAALVRVQQPNEAAEPVYLNNGE
ncbi:hypothetical protein ACLOJK_014068 [Asimina triloba]